MSDVDQKTTGKFQAGKSGNPHGRPKGIPNKVTRLAREAIAEAAEGLGGTERLIEWAMESPDNEKAFWTQLYPKLIPVQITGENGAAIQIEQRVREDADAVQSAISSLVERAREAGVVVGTQH